MGESKTLTTLFPSPRRQILSALFGEPSRWWTLTELAGRAGVLPSSAGRHVRQLRDGGVVAEKEDSVPRAFRANMSCPVLSELQVIFCKLDHAAHSGETILVAEDQPATAQITRILLESWGYRVLEAQNGAEALELFARHAGEIHLLLTDVMIPGMSGAQLADEVLLRKPDVRVVFMSGYPGEELDGRECAFLSKPFNPASLSRMIRNELDRQINGA